MLITARFGPAHRQPTGLVEMAQQRHAVTAQHRLHRRAGQPQVGGDAMRAPAPREAHLDDPPLPTLRKPTWTAMWATGAVDHGLRPAGTVTVGPFLGRGRRALEPLSGSGIRPTVIDDTTSKPQPATWGQTGISVGHEDLSVIGVYVVTTPIPEVLTYFRSPRRSQPVEELHLARETRRPRCRVRRTRAPALRTAP